MRFKRFAKTNHILIIPDIEVAVRNQLTQFLIRCNPFIKPSLELRSPFGSLQLVVKMSADFVVEMERTIVTQITQGKCVVVDKILIFKSSIRREGLNCVKDRFKILFL